MEFKLDYDQMVHLDAEQLAECGIGEAYKSLLPKLREYVAEPALIEEIIDNDAPRYVVRSGANEFLIYAPQHDEAEGPSWGRATFAFFTIVNNQLVGSDVAVLSLRSGERSRRGGSAGV